MKFTAQEEYGLRCILSLGRASPQALGTEEGSFLTVRSVAEQEGLSVQYAGKLFRILAKAGLVVSVRGCKGGYRLARAAEEITVAEILAALGGKIYEPKVCERYSGDRRFCVHSNDCSIRSLWSGLQLIVDTILSRTTLRDLVGSERSIGQWMQRNLEAVEQLVASLSADDPPHAEFGVDLAGQRIQIAADTVGVLTDDETADSA